MEVTFHIKIDFVVDPFLHYDLCDISWVNKLACMQLASIHHYARSYAFVKKPACQCQSVDRDRIAPCSGKLN